MTYTLHYSKVLIVSKNLLPAILAVSLWQAVSAAELPGPEVVLQTGHVGDIRCAAITADGRFAVTGGSDGKAILWEANTGRVLRVFAQESAFVNAAKRIAISNDGRRVLVEGELTAAGYVSLWDTVTGKGILSLGLSPYSALSPDGKWAVGTNEYRKGVQFYDAATGKPDGEPALVREPGPRAVAFSTDSRRLATAETDNRIVVWDVARRGVVKELAGTAESYALALNDGGTRLLAAVGKEAVLWDTATGKELFTLRHKFDSEETYIRGVWLSADGKVGVTSHGERWGKVAGQGVAVWDLERKVVTKSFPGAAVGAGVSLAANRLVTTDGDVRDLRTGARVAGLPRGVAEPDGRYRKVSISPDFRRAAFLTAQGTVTVWDFDRSEKLRTFQAIACSAVSLSRDGRQVLIGEIRGDGKRREKVAVLRDVETGKELRVLGGHVDTVTSVALSDDGSLALTGCEDKTATLWDLRPGKKSEALKGHAARLAYVAFADGGRRALTVAPHDDNGTAILWDAKTGEKLAAFPPGAVPLADRPPKPKVEFDPAKAGQQAAERLKMAVEGPLPKGPEAADLRSAKASADGRFVLGSREKGVFLWDTSTGEATQIAVLDHSSSPPRALGLSHDGKALALVNEDGTLVVVHDSGKLDRRIVVPTRLLAASEVAFSDDRKRVAVIGAGNPCVAVFDTATGRELVRLYLTAEDDDWVAVTPDGRFDGSRGGREKVSYRVGGGLTVVPVDRFFESCYRPGLFADVWAGNARSPVADFGAEKPPALRIVTPMGGDTEATVIDVVVEAVDRGGGVDGPYLFHQGTRLFAAVKTEQEKGVVRRTFRVRLVAGENRLEARAGSGTGAWDVDPATVTVHSLKPVVKPNLFVLAVGVGKYADANLTLRFPAADARAIVEVFAKRGKGNLYGKVTTTVLTDGEATPDTIKAAVGDIADRARPEDTFVIYLAGQGLTVGGRYYFLPADFATRGGEKDEAVESRGMSVEALAEAASRVPALRRVLVLDATGAGGGTGMAIAGRNPFGFRGAVERLNRSQGTFAIAAVAATADAGERAELGHGLLTYALLAALGGVENGPLKGRRVVPASGDGVADLGEWFAFAAAAAREIAPAGHHDIKVSGLGVSFPLLPVSDR